VAAKADERLACADQHTMAAALVLVDVQRAVLRLPHATDALAWGLSGIWDGQAAYRPRPTRCAASSLTSRPLAARPIPTPITLMNMHKSIGKESTRSPSGAAP
jgi:hypothetical protein